MTGLPQQQNELQGMKGQLPFSNFVYSVHISPKFEYIYVETPKAGCSTIKKTLVRAELDDPHHGFEHRSSIHRRDLSPLLDPTQVPDFQKLATSGEFFRFCFVRNPYVRLLSAYLDKFFRPNEQRAHFKRQTGLSGEISFAQFIAAICAQPVEQMDNHWRIQYYQTLQDEMPYDFIGRTETLEPDLRFVGEKLGLDFARFFEAERSHAQGAKSRLGEFYTSDIASAVQKKFALDFDHFRYSRDLSEA